ncbi:Crp/Fnr family transcriptional regulator [Geobacter sp. SVR]|uniref:Crp/Fnr family transcriptional regulator n=1 Tax=Geobacter sp. SVR TaxID=2495594 RepID=UPI00143F0277|nr:Crp/Fnr family transcriptional regulator [Geobacter sp. SVR]BCS54992.1 CarD family transcriptional regulator [Geobacter sp. SVR]GCF85174.1 CarD family transcriptional regulator [Geobacter sp. SVR]
MKNSTALDHRHTLEKIPLFSCLLADKRAKLQQIISEKHYKKNSIILMEDDSKNYMYVIFSGKIKVVRVNPDGKEQILVIRKRGDFFGEMTLLDGKAQPATIVAMEDATVGLISKSDFEQFFMKDENVLKQIIALLCERLRESWMLLRVLSLSDAETRVRAVLAHISSVYGVKDLRGIIIPFKLTHKEIADHAALTRETVSRLLSRLSQSGEIEIIDNKNIVLKSNFEKPY